MSQVIDFLPDYPTLDDESFQRTIASKEEFASLKLQVVEGGKDSEAKETRAKPRPGSGSGFDYFDYQKMLARYLGPYTPYQRMLWYIEVGAGKTCTAMALHHIMKDFYTVKNPSLKFKQTLFLAKGKLLLNNIKNEFLKRCPGLPKNIKTAKEIKDHVRENFSFNTLQHFVNNVIYKSSDETLKNKYSNMTIIIDEGQDLKKHKSKSETNMYTQLGRFFNAIDNSNVIIMTGTPIIEEAFEPVGLVNLLTPKDERLPLGQKFYNEFYGEDDQLRDDKRKKLEEFFRGKVAFVRQMGSVAKKIFNKSPHTSKKWLSSINVYACPMSEFQYKVYRESLEYVKKDKDQSSEKLFEDMAGDDENPILGEDVEGVSGGAGDASFKKGKGAKKSPAKKSAARKGKSDAKKADKEEGGQQGGSFYQYSRESGMFVYPDGTYGKEGFEKHIVKKKTVTVGKKTRTETTFTIPKPFKDLFLKDLKRYSSKYAATVNLMLSKPDECFYIFSDLVNNSGLILFGLILQLYGYKQQTTQIGPNTEAGRRFVSLNYEQTTSENALKLIDSVSSEKNATGSYIQAVLGSEMSSYGITIKNVRNVVILSPQWNEPTMKQIVGRGVRPGSDAFLKKLGLPTDVNIYLEVATAPVLAKGEKRDEEFAKSKLKYDPEEITTDVLLYQLAEAKQRKNEPMLQLLKEVSAICPLAYKRNVLSKDENYKCAEMEPTGVDKKGIYTYDIPEDEIQKSNYNMYYSDEKIDLIVENIKLWFSKHFTMDVIKMIENNEYDVQLFLMALERMIDGRIGVTNKFGKVCYLKEHNNIAYLQNEITDDNDISEVFYVSNYSLPYDTSLDDIIEIESIERDASYKAQFGKVKNEEEALELFKKMHFHTKILLFESCYRHVSSAGKKGGDGGSGVKKSDRSYKIANAIVKDFSTSYDVVDLEDGRGNVAYHSLYAEKQTGTSYNVSAKLLEDTGKMRMFNKDKLKWEQVDREMEDKVNKKIKARERESMKNVFEGNSYNMYGTVSSKDNKFRIALEPVEGKKMNKGKVCSSFKVPVLFDILFALKKFPEPPESISSMSREELESALLGQMKLTDTSIRDNIRKKSSESGYITTQKLKQYLTIVVMKIDELCEFIQQVMRDADILYDI